jgi:hypothetical protein
MAAAMITRCWRDRRVRAVGQRDYRAGLIGASVALALEGLQLALPPASV